MQWRVLGNQGLGTLPEQPMGVGGGRTTGCSVRVRAGEEHVLMEGGHPGGSTGKRVWAVCLLSEAAYTWQGSPAQRVGVDPSTNHSSTSFLTSGGLGGV